MNADWAADRLAQVWGMTGSGRLDDVTLVSNETTLSPPY